VFPLAEGMQFFGAFRQAMRTQHYIHLEEYSPVLAIWIENHIYPSEKGISVFFRDISRRKKAEAAKKASEEKYRSLVEQAPDAIIISAPDGQVITANTSAGRISEYSDAELLRMNIADFFVKEDIAKNTSQFNGLSKGKTITAERLMKTKSGRIVNLEITSKMLADSNLLSFARDVSERVKAQNEIKETTEKLRNLGVHLTNIREEERKRIGREIHDELGQLLTAMKMDAVWIDKNLTAGNPGLLREKLKNIIRMLDDSNVSIARIISELRPVIFDTYSLIDALKLQNAEFTKNTGIPVHFSFPEEIPAFPEPVTICIFRVHQEALTNIMRYSRAKNVTSTLSVVENMVVFKIEDDGVGFDMRELKSSQRFGLLGITERVRSLGGDFSLVAAQSEGTKLIISIPLFVHETTTDYESI
jgi:PAS domain S-box-containing protein